MKDSLILANGQEVRVEVNWLAIANFCDDVGIDNLAGLDNLGKMKPREYPILMYRAIQEGERLEGREFVDFNKFEELLRLPQITEFTKIYTRQALPPNEKKNLR